MWIRLPDRWSVWLCAGGWFRSFSGQSLRPWVRSLHKANDTITIPQPHTRKQLCTNYTSLFCAVVKCHKPTWLLIVGGSSSALLILITWNEDGTIFMQSFEGIHNCSRKNNVCGLHATECECIKNGGKWVTKIYKHEICIQTLRGQRTFRIKHNSYCEPHDFSKMCRRLMVCINISNFLPPFTYTF